MQKCQYCDKPFVLNKNLDKIDLPPSFKEKIKYIPDCDCIDKNSDKELRESIKKMELEGRKNLIKKYKDISIMDSKLKSCSFDSVDMTDKHMRIAKRYCEMLLKDETESRGMILSGGVGTGKTTASACIANYLMKNGKTVLVMNIAKYLIKLKQDWSKAEADILNYAAKCDLLILDDVGTDKTTEFMLEKTFNLLDARYRVSKPLIITTNLEYSETGECDLEAKFEMDGHGRIKDRIKEMCVHIPCEGESRRNSNRKDFISKLKGV